MDKRLQAAAALYTAGEIGADIGTDHGFLPCAILEQGICQRMIASDLRMTSLEKAKREASLRGLSDRIDFVLSDGLDAVDREVCCISITGLGGRNMAEILNRGEAHIGQADLLLCAHTDLPEVRKCIQKLGRHFSREQIVFSAGRFYLLWKVRKESAVYTEDELEFGTPLLFENPKDLTKAYLNWRIQVESACLTGLLKKNAADPTERYRQQERIRKLSIMLGGIR